MAKILNVDVANYGDEVSRLDVYFGQELLRSESWPASDIMGSAVRVSNRAEQELPDIIYVDTGGLGMGLFECLKDRGLPVREVGWFKKPKDDKEAFFRSVNRRRRAGLK